MNGNACWHYREVWQFLTRPATYWPVITISAGLTISAGSAFSTILFYLRSFGPPPATISHSRFWSALVKRVSQLCFAPPGWPCSFPPRVVCFGWWWVGGSIDQYCHERYQAWWFWGFGYWVVVSWFRLIVFPFPQLGIWVWGCYCR